MDFSYFKNKTSRTNLLNEVDVLGSYDFYTALITLESLKKYHAEEALTAINSIPDFFDFKKTKSISIDQYVSLAKVLPLAYHEYTHFVDANSTCWGFDYLKKMNAAYLSKTGNERGFYKAKEFYDHSRWRV